MRRLLVGLEVALSAILLVGMGLIVQATIVQFAKHYGFPAQNTTKLSVTLPQDGFSAPASRAPSFAQIAARVRALPGVVAAGWTDSPPLEDFEGSVKFSPAATWRRTAQGYMFITSPGYLPALGAPLLAGRNFRPSDSTSAPRMAFTNRPLARRYFGGGVPIGKFVSVKVPSGRRTFRIIGVVGNVEDYVGQ